MHRELLRTTFLQVSKSNHASLGTSTFTLAEARSGQCRTVESARNSAGGRLFRFIAGTDRQAGQGRARYLPGRLAGRQGTLGISRSHCLLGVPALGAPPSPPSRDGRGKGKGKGTNTTAVCLVPFLLVSISWPTARISRAS